MIDLLEAYTKPRAIINWHKLYLFVILLSCHPKGNFKIPTDTISINLPAYYSILKIKIKIAICMYNELSYHHCILYFKYLRIRSFKVHQEPIYENYNFRCQAK